MANATFKDAAAITQSAKTDGAGSDANPFVALAARASGALGALDAAVTVRTQGDGTIWFEIDTGTLVGTVIFEATLDDATWFTVQAVREDTGAIISSLTSFGVRGEILSGNASQTRLRVSAFTSGTSNARVVASGSASVARIPEVGRIDEAEAAGNGTLIAILKRLRTLLAGGLPAALAGGRLDVNVGNAPTVTANAGTGTRDVQGNVAHDGVDSGNPVKVGGKAIAHGANPTEVAAADRTDWYFNRAGVPFVIGGHMNPFTEESQFTAAQTDVALKTVAAGTKIAVTRVSVMVDKANTVDVGYRLGFAAATLPAGGTGVAGILSSHPGLAAGSGAVEGNGGGLLGIGTDDQDLRFTCEVPTTGSIRVTVTGFTIGS